MHWDDLGFPVEYTVDDQPDYPRDGEWGMPVVEVTHPIRTLVGPAQAVIRPDGAEPWVLAISVSDDSALFSGPDPRMLYILDRYDRLVGVDVFDPSRRVNLHDYPVRASAKREHDLLLVADWTRLTAVGAGGVLWRSEHLALDDLKVIRADATGIVCVGADYSLNPVAVQVTLDPVTGRIVEGEPFTG